MDQKEKWNKLEQIEKELNKKFDTTHSLVKLGSKIGISLPSIPTGLFTLDNNVIQTGGIPYGRLVEIFGPESSGKTTFALHLIGCEQKKGGIAAFVDAEHALDVNWAKKLGVNVDELLVSQPNNGEEALQTVEALVDSGAVSLIIIDSVSALVPRAELEGEIGDAHVGQQARLMSQACRILTGKCMRNNVTIVWINQIREKIGIMFGNPETTSGGRALKFYASVRLDVRRLSKGIQENDELSGHEIKFKCVKNKVGVPFRETVVRLLYDSGFDTKSDLVEYAISEGVVEQSGGWLSFNGKKYRKEGLIEVLDEIKEKLKENKNDSI